MIYMETERILSKLESFDASHSATVTAALRVYAEEMSAEAERQGMAALAAPLAEAAMKAYAALEAWEDLTELLP